MARLSRTPLALLLALASQAGLGVASRCPGGNAGSAVEKALYFITNDEANAVVALRVGPDGLLSPGSVTPTNGAGSVALDSKNQPATPDALVSQSALTVAGNVSLIQSQRHTVSGTLANPTCRWSSPSTLALIP